MLNILTDMTCGGFSNLKFDSNLPNITSTIVTVIEIAVPIILVIFGMLDLGKAVIAQKEDDIKKGQQTFVKRLIAAIIVFLVVFVVKLVIGLVVSDDNKDILGCMNCFISNNCTETGVGSGEQPSLQQG